MRVISVGFTKLIPRPMYGNEPYGPTETLNSDSNVHKAKAHLSKHKHKSHFKDNHKTKHHTTKLLNHVG